MNDTVNQIRQTVILIKYYNFDLNGYDLKSWLSKWCKIYTSQWLNYAVMEAIYQGRLKCISVEQILNTWLKKGQITSRFNHEFIRLVKPCDRTLNPDEEKELAEIFLEYGVSPSDLPVEKINQPLELSEIVNDYPLISNPLGQEKRVSQCHRKLKAFAEDDYFNFQPLAE